MPRQKLLPLKIVAAPCVAATFNIAIGMESIGKMRDATDVLSDGGIRFDCLIEKASGASAKKCGRDRPKSDSRPERTGKGPRPVQDRPIEARYRFVYETI
jgi:hypothetical protein